MADGVFNLWQFDAYLFDIDGTLANTRGGVHYNSFHSALREVYGCEGRIDPVPVHGNTDIGILRAALRHHGKLNGDFEAHLPAARALMCAEVARNTDAMEVELCPAIPELLGHLRRRNKLMGVVTGNFEQIGWRKLERGGLRHFFDFGSFSDTREKREDIFRHGVETACQIRGPGTSVCLIGDTPSDIRAAAQLALPVVAVATGIYSREELAREAPTLCVSTCAELLSLPVRD
ncbi:MAG TPA: HAD family hydrolase [Candidatus Binatia bacterium]|nr:HAD family hydrolase [Candidatus Binatia bacterium]